MTDWLILTATLPTSPSALRVRVWRALKATAAAALRDGVYVLPADAPMAAALWDIERTISAAGADAHMLVVTARDVAQEQTFRRLFDRSDAYADVLAAIKVARRSIVKGDEAALHKTLRAIEQQLHAVQAIDFFPGKTSHGAIAALAALRREIEQHLSPGEPLPATQAIETLAVADFQRRTWATRKRPWVDRLATAWLIGRFIDDAPKFIWLADPARCPARAIGYDFDGARFTHVGDRVTFEVVARSFALDDDPAIKRIGDLVHYIDVGGIPVDEAPGVETIVRGLHARYASDGALLDAAVGVFDSLHAAAPATP